MYTSVRFIVIIRLNKLTLLTIRQYPTFKGTL